MIKVASINSIYIEPETGHKYFSTKTENHYYPDTAELTNEVILGRVLIHFKYIGILIRIIQSKLFSLISILLLCWIYYLNKFKFKEKINRKIKKSEGKAVNGDGAK